MNKTTACVFGLGIAALAASASAQLLGTVGDALGGLVEQTGLAPEGSFLDNAVVHTLEGNDETDDTSQSFLGSVTSLTAVGAILHTDSDGISGVTDVLLNESDNGGSTENSSHTVFGFPF